MTGIGLAIAIAAAMMGLLQGSFFKGLWVSWQIGPLKLDLGTPMLFDLGVFLVVLSVVVSYLLSLSRSNEQETL